MSASGYTAAQAHEIAIRYDNAQIRCVLDCIKDAAERGLFRVIVRQKLSDTDTANIYERGFGIKPTDSSDTWLIQWNGKGVTR